MKRSVLFLILGLSVPSTPALADAVAGQTAPHRAPWMGVEMTPGGGNVLVRHVVRTSPAEKAGIHDGDRIIRVGGVAVTQADEVTRNVTNRAPGDVVDVVIEHDGKEQTVRVTLAPRPSGDDMLRMEYVGTFAPPLTGLTAAAGNVPASIRALRGRVTVLEFWATWCGPCRMTMPVLDGWQSRYGAQGLSVIGITSDPADRAAAFVAQNAIHYSIASDTTNATSLAYGVRTIPTLFVLDKRGVVRDVTTGYDPGVHVQLERLVQQLLAEPAPATTLTPLSPNQTP